MHNFCPICVYFFPHNELASIATPCVNTNWEIKGTGKRCAVHVGNATNETYYWFMQKITTTTSITIVTVTTTTNNNHYQYHQQWSRACDCVVVLRLAITFLLYFQLTNQHITHGLKLIIWSLIYRGIDELWYEPMWSPSPVVFKKKTNMLTWQSIIHTPCEASVLWYLSMELIESN